MLLWILVICVGLIGAIADVMVSYWSQTNRLSWWLGAAVGSLGFVTGLGVIIRRGMSDGYTLTIALVLVVLCNLALVVVWDVYSSGTSPTVLQWVGVVLALGAVVCLELGRK